MSSLPRARLAAGAAAPPRRSSRKDARTHRTASLLTLLFALALTGLLPANAYAQTATAGQLVISEFRLRGAFGANDEFIEIYNNTDNDHTVSAASGTGYGVAASDGVTRCTIPNGTVIPARGHYLCVNSIAYSLAAYPAGNGTTATGDSTYTIDIPDNAGVAIFNNNVGAGSYNVANRLDAVGSTSEANVIYKEGTGYPALTPFSIDYSFTRKLCSAPFTCTGLPQDTNNNASDLLFVDTNGTSAGAGQSLGAPGPENLSSPVRLAAPPTGIVASLLDPFGALSSSGNYGRDFTSDPANNSTFGTLSFRRTFTNNTGGTVTRLRFRIGDLTTFPSPSGTADLRPRTSGPVTVLLTGGGSATAQGTTLEQPPDQFNGGGFNSSLSANTIALATPLANGGSVNLQFLLGIQQTGDFRFCVTVETLPGAGSEVLCFGGNTETGPVPVGTPSPTPPPAAAGQLIISEFRLRGPNGANDEFIEIYNASGSDHTVAATSGTGYGVAASDGITRCTIPNGTVIPNRGHYLCVNSVAYSLAAYPAGNGTTATGDATYTTNINDNAGIAIFNNNTGGGSYTLANRLDAVGSTSEANTLYREGTGYTALTPFSIDYSFYRTYCPRASAATDPVCSPGATAAPQDTNNNVIDFVFVDTNGTSAGAGQRLGAPGPENLSSPIDSGAGLSDTVLDAAAADTAPPNVVRDFTSDPFNNSTFGTLDIRRTYTNNTGANVTRLRFRVADIETFPAPSGVADLRPRTSNDIVVTTSGGPVTVRGTTLEQPPSQPNGGGFNSSLGSGTVNLGTPLAPGASVSVQFLAGIQQTGDYRMCLVVETLPGSGSSLLCFNGNTESVTPTPTPTPTPSPTPTPFPTPTGPPANPGDIIISEFRLRGAFGANDEYVEVYNNTDVDHVVSSADATGGGYAIVASDGVTRVVIPNNTVIPAHGHYLAVNSVAYSLAAYPAGNGTTATGDATYTTDIPDNAGIALFRTTLPANFNLANRLDAVGSTSEANTLYKEGTGYPALTPFSIDYAFYRDLCGIPASAGTCSQNGLPKDTNNNASDFVFVDTNGTSAGAGQRLGAPGPENLSSPGHLNSASGVSRSLLDGAVPVSATPNRVRDFTSDPANNSTFGTVAFRRTFTNNTGANITRLRFRVIDLTTFPSPSGTADLRPRTSPTISVATSSGTVVVRGTTLEEPPSQPNGGGFNSTLSVGSVTLATPLAPGASVSAQLLFGIQQTGDYRFAVVIETLPFTGSQVWVVRGNTETNTDVEGANVAPVANNDSYSTNQNTTLNVSAPGVLANDTDANGDALTAQLVAGPSHGSLTLNPDGSFTYMPASGYVGPDSFTYRANDGTANSNVATVNITVNDTQAPVLTASVATTVLQPANSNLVNVGLSASATDNSGGPVTITVQVFGDEDDQTATAPGTVHSPDAKNIAPGTLRLRAERVNSGDGRVYLIIVKATDSSGNTSFKSLTVVVPNGGSAAALNSVNAQATAARNYADANNGAPPPGYFVIGDGAIIGPKQ